jgi:hypothetical protein
MFYSQYQAQSPTYIKTNEHLPLNSTTHRFKKRMFNVLAIRHHRYLPLHGINFVSRATLGRVCLKLVVVMGLTWLADVISWAVGGPHYIWYVTDLINTLQGVLIFIVAGCQPQVWSAINRLWCLRPQHTQRTNMGHHISLYSQGPPSLGDSVTNNHSTKSAHLETLC